MLNPSRQAYLKDAAFLAPDEIENWERFSSSVPHNASPFLSTHFARAVAESGVDARVCIIREKGEIVAFFPYQYASKWAKRWKVAQRVGGELTDSFGIIARPEFRTSARELLELTKINYLSFSHLDEAQLRYGLIAEQPRIGLRALLDPASVPALTSVQSVTRHYLKDSAKRQRKMCDEVGPISFHFDVKSDRTQLLEMLIDQKRAQYRSGGVTDSLKEPWKRNVLATLANYQFGTCSGVLSTLFAGDKWIASHFGIMGNGTLHLWFPVYNPEFARYSPGRLLLHHIVESCASHGFHTIDRGEGDTPRKREIANEEYRLYRGVWQNQSGISRFTHAVNRVRWKVGF
jgi:CelD/BcsL family acetyltransferase involved in cellulose biosynthesis